MIKSINYNFSIINFLSCNDKMKIKGGLTHPVSTCEVSVCAEHSLLHKV